MFELVPKCTKGKIKSCWTGCCSLKRRVARLSDQLPITFWARSLGACSSELCPESTGLVRLELAWRSLKWTVPESTVHARLALSWRSLKRTLISSVKIFRVSNPFSPKIPILIFPNPKLVLNNVYRSYTWKYTQWCIKLEIKTSFHQNSAIHQTFTIFQQKQQFSSPIHK